MATESGVLFHCLPADRASCCSLALEASAGSRVQPDAKRRLSTRAFLIGLPSRGLRALHNLQGQPPKSSIAIVDICGPALLHAGASRHSSRQNTDISLLSPAQATIKRMVDLLVSLTGLLLTLPLLLGIAIAIKLDSPGPILFRQDRVGLGGAVFKLWKFRTMYQRSDAASLALQTSRNDSRVTPLGRLLRRTSLDELPQLINVLNGDMSIIGPRPHAFGMTVAGQVMTELLPFYDERHRVKPGITGWAQVNGSRGELASVKALRRRIALDRHYIENWSLHMDIAILARTAALPFVDRHAF